MPLIPIAWPVIHSAGGYIAAYKGSYLLGTASSSYIISFISGNTILSSVTATATAVSAYFGF